MYNFDNYNNNCCRPQKKCSCEKKQETICLKCWCKEEPKKEEKKEHNCCCCNKREDY